MVAGPAMGLVFSLATGFKPLSPRSKQIFIVEGPPSHVEIVRLVLYQDQGWKADLLFTVLGFLLACGVIWLLEELRAYKRHIRE